MIGEHLPPLAFSELLELTRILQRGDVASIHAWIDRNSVRVRRRERYVVRGLADVAVAPYSRDGFEALEIDDHATDAQRLAARLIAATILDDTDTVEALIETWSTWPAPYRADTVRALVGAAIREYGNTS